MIDIRFIAAAGLAALALAGCGAADVGVDGGAPRVVAATDLEAGRYLVKVAGCNDCHTPGYIQSGGITPEADWLKGNNHGFMGPWGTTYPHNLRLTTAALTEDAWVEMLNTRKTRPIMPWPSVAAMADADKRAIYRYIRSLPGDPGQPAPVALPPGQVPTATSYEDLNIRMPAAASPPR